MSDGELRPSIVLPAWADWIYLTHAVLAVTIVQHTISVKESLIKCIPLMVRLPLVPSLPKDHRERNQQPAVGLKPVE